MPRYDRHTQHPTKAARRRQARRKTTSIHVGTAKRDKPVTSGYRGGADPTRRPVEP